jgi:photosystem II stability/assembly factor-like uncharacterized protein
VNNNSSYKVDTIPPAVTTFEMDDIEIKTGETATVDLVFSEAVCADYGVCGSNVFTSAADITVISDNGNVSASGSLTLNSDQAIDNKTIWTGTFTPDAPKEVDINRLSLATTYTDLAGNNGPDNQTENFDVDTKRPEVDSFTMSDVNLDRNDNATVELVFSEPVIGFFSDEDITIPNLNQEPLHDNSTASGTLSTMISDDNITWTGTFIPAFPITNTEDWTNRLVLSDNYTDYDYNTGSGETGENYIVDDKDPSVISFTIEDNGISVTQLLYNETAMVTLVFSEVVNFSSAADITAVGTAGASDNGSLATMESDDNITWTGTFTPPVNTEEENNTLNLAASWTDTVGNPGTDNTTSNFEIETKRPTVSSFTFSSTDNRSHDGNPAFKPGDNSTVTLVFSEVVTNFSSAANITANNVDLDNMTSNDNITWTGIFTPTNNTSVLENRLRLASGYTDIAGNTGSSWSNAKWSDDNDTSIYVIDTGAAAVSSFSPADDVCIPITENIIVTFDFPMEPSYITTTTSTTCRAETIQVSSSDDSGVFFNTPNCVPFPGNPVASDSNTTFTLDPVNNLEYNTTYKIKVTTGAKSALENDLSREYESSFTTSHSPSSSVSGFFMAVGSGGKILRSTDNGSSWGIATSCQFSTDLADVTFGNNTSVAVGLPGKIVRSTNSGSSWDNVTSVDSQYLYGITYGNNTFVAVGQSGNILRSTDNASSWNDSNSGISQQLYGITFGNNTFVAVGTDGKIVRSTDNGTSWDNSTSPTGNGLYGVTFGNNTFVAVGQSGIIVRSTDNASSFDNATSGITDRLEGVTYGNNTFVAAGYLGNIVRSTDNGSSWDNATSNTSNLLNGVTFGNNTFVGVGQSGNIVRSTDNGTNWDNSTSPIATGIKGVTFSE